MREVVTVLEFEERDSGTLEERDSATLERESRVLEGVSDELKYLLILFVTPFNEALLNISLLPFILLFLLLAAALQVDLLFYNNK